MLINVYTNNKYTKEYAKHWERSAKIVEGMYDVKITVNVKRTCTEAIVERGEIRKVETIPWFEECNPGLVLRRLAITVKLKGRYNYVDQRF